MKRRWIIFVGLAAVTASGLYLLLRSGDGGQRAVEETRRALRKQGFKTDLADFDFSTSDELRARAAALTNASTFNVPSSHGDAARRSLRQQVMPEFMWTVGTDSAVLVWREDPWPADAGTAVYLRLAGQSSNDVWTALRESFNDDREVLDAACTAALSGPIRFHLSANHGNAMLLPHLAALKNLTQTLGCRAILELHDGNKDAAWTNLLALTRLATAYNPESAEISHLVRFACAAIACEATWQVLQAGGWSEDRLVQLREEWEEVDFFKGLPETAAFKRASMVAVCQQERQEPRADLATALRDALRSPRFLWPNLKEIWGRREYRHHGSYEDENALLLHYRDRELELRRAIQCTNWAEMRQLPGVTNPAPFRSKYHSRMQTMMNMRQISLNFSMEGRGLLGRAAEAAGRRRLVITAIALERYRGRHGSHPKALQDLAPELLESPPTDFMDGKPLRYRLTDDGHFVLYSVGLDCVDNGGTMERYARHRFPSQRFESVGGAMDLVWPCPASAADVATQKEEEQKQTELAQAVGAERQAEQERQAEIERQATVARLLTMKPAPRSKEPMFEGRPLSKVFRGTGPPGAPPPTLNEMLTLKQITTGDEPQIATFEMPICYETITNFGELRLLVDVDPQDASGGRGDEEAACSRATNGNCRLVWDTIYAPPGQHALQAQLVCTENKSEREVEARGPVLPFYSSNVFQLDRLFGVFGTRAYFSAKLAESNGVYTIKVTSPAGVHVKTFSGTVSNGVIRVPWDLKDDHGNRYTNDSFGCDFQVTLPDSGRSQTLRGP